jgi:uncharacterized membrane protein YkvA (DUF1232 family)
MRLFKEMGIIGLAMICALYLMFPSLIPDFLPFVGWVDEGFCTLILANTASYYGINLTNIYGRNERRVIVRKKVTRKPRTHSDEADSPILDKID